MAVMNHTLFAHTRLVPVIITIIKHTYPVQGTLWWRRRFLQSEAFPFFTSAWLTIFNIIHCCLGLTCSTEHPFLVISIVLNYSGCGTRPKVWVKELYKSWPHMLITLKCKLSQKFPPQTKRNSTWFHKIVTWFWTAESLIIWVVYFYIYWSIKRHSASYLPLYGLYAYAIVCKERSQLTWSIEPVLN